MTCPICQHTGLRPPSSAPHDARHYRFAERKRIGSRHRLANGRFGGGFLVPHWCPTCSNLVHTAETIQ